MGQCKCRGTQDGDLPSPWLWSLSWLWGVLLWEVPLLPVVGKLAAVGEGFACCCLALAPAFQGEATERSWSVPCSEILWLLQ